jgi:hypothetical protein
LTGFEIHFAGGSCGDDRSDLLFADRENHFGQAECDCCGERTGFGIESF